MTGPTHGARKKHAMSDTAAPPMDRTDWLLSQLAETLERAQRLFEDVAELVDTVRHPDRPPSRPATPRPARSALSAARVLAHYAGVTFVTDYASEVMVGDRVQRCHGDPDWHLVTEAAASLRDRRGRPVDHPEADDGREWVRIVHDGTAHYWLATDAIRIATAPVPDPAPYRMVQP